MKITAPILSGFVTKVTALILVLLVVRFSATAQKYQPIAGWSTEVNQKIETFLNSTKIIKERKVAVFDCDGTLFGQVPYYLADECLYAYGQDQYGGKKDTLSRHKMAIMHRMLQEDNTSMQYVKDRIDFIAGMTKEAVERIGLDCYHEKYQQKFYPQMRSLLANLEAFNFEVWVISASPEVLYQGFVHEALGIPKDRILGVKSIIRHDSLTRDMVLPVPQEAGKADALQTFIKAKPLFVGGNSRGDMEMMNESVGLKLIINPDKSKIETGAGAGAMAGSTVYDYWKKQKNCLIVNCEDIAVTENTTNQRQRPYITGALGIKANKATKSTQ